MVRAADYADRGVGGRQLVELEMYTMRRKVLNAKSGIDNKLDPKISSRIVPRKSTRTQSPLTEPHGVVGNELRASHKRMMEVAKGGLYKGKEGRCKITGKLMHVPDTVKAGLSTRISVNRRVGKQAKDHATHEHSNNIVHMHRRIEQGQSLTERKKNAFDGTIYPALIRRRPCSAKPTTLVSNAVRASVAAPSEFTAARAYSGGAPHCTVPAVRPASAPPLRRAAYTQRRVAGTALPAHLHGAYDQFYNALMEAIVKERMYQEQPLRRLFREFVKSAGGGMQQVAERVVAQLAAELDVRPA